MHSRKKATEEATKPETKAEKKPRAKPIRWDDNKEWTHRAINYLVENPTFRKKLFSDSTTEAKEEGRKKVQGHEGKIILYGTIAQAIFTHEDTDQETRLEYDADPNKFARSTQQQFARLVSVSCLLVKPSQIEIIG
jgi:hypothetical protein